jgi:hypothetical protein
MEAIATAAREKPAVDFDPLSPEPAQLDDARHTRPGKLSALLVLDPISTSAARCRVGSVSIA